MTVKNNLEDIVYIEPDLTLPVPDGMCTTCHETNSNLPEQNDEEGEGI